MPGVNLLPTHITTKGNQPQLTGPDGSGPPPGATDRGTPHTGTSRRLDALPAHWLRMQVHKQTRHRDTGLSEDVRLPPWANADLDLISWNLLGFSHNTDRVRISPAPRRAWLAPESKDSLDVASEATLRLLLQLVLQGWESHMVEGQVKEQRLARDGLESWWEVHEVGLLGDEGRVQAECLKPFNQRLEVQSKGGIRG